MPLYTFFCTQRGQWCEEVEVLCSHAEAVASHTPPLPLNPLPCPICGSPLMWQGAELPRVADLSGNRGGNFKMKAITQAGQKIPLAAGRSSRTPKRTKVT